MRLYNVASGVSTTPFQVTMANMETEAIEAAEVYTEGGALILMGPRSRLVVAFGPGAWLEVQPA